MSASAALGLVLLTWLSLAPALAGVGLLAARAFRVDLEPVECFWLGLASVLVALQWWILVLPVARLALGALALAAVAGWALEGRGALRRWGRPGWRAALLSAALACVALWLAARALGPPNNDDSGVYHLGAVRWASEHPVVPGIGNLHPFLAVNHGFFLFAALVGAVPWAPGVLHVANGLPALGFLAVALRGSLDLVRRPALAPAPRSGSLAAATLLPWAVFCAQSSDVANVSSDLCELALGGAFVALWVGAFDREGEERARALRLGTFVVAALAVVKLSAAGAVAGVLLAVWAVSPGRRLRALARATGVGLVAGVPHAAGLVLRSGYLPYPGALLAFPVDWRMPRAMVVAVDRWTLAWGRGTTVRWDAPGDWSWLPTRLELLATYYQEFVIPLALGALLFALALVARWSAAPSSRPPPWAVALPALGGVAFWLLSSPSLRYAGIWPQAVAATLAAAAAGAGAPPRFTRWLAPALLLVGAGRAADLLGELSFAVPEPALEAPRPPGRWEQNAHGTRAFVPDGDQCWAAPLPCTPHLDPALELREPGSLDHGFRLQVDLETYRPATLRVLGR